MTSIYLDNGATSFPKPTAVADAMHYYMTQVGASINRGVYASAQDAGMTTLLLRENLCRLFNHSDPTHCILTSGNTMGLNMVIRGALAPGDHCLVSSMEHNAVMRPLNDLLSTGVSFDRIPCDREGRLCVDAIPAMIRPNTKLIIIAHGSNVSGTVQDAQAVGDICRRHSIPFALDAAQTAGHWPVDFDGWNLSALSVPGHKGLMGPGGIGALLLSPKFAENLKPIITGGTGSASDTEVQPDYMPDKFESGTPNLPGIYGFHAATEFILSTGVDAMRRHEDSMTRRFLDGIAGSPGVRLVGPASLEGRVAVISLDFTEKDNAEVAYALEQEFGIMTRCGLHCAPSAHRTLGTFPHGTVRFSPGFFTTNEEIDTAIRAIRTIASR